MKQTFQAIIYTICVLLFLFLSILWYREMLKTERADDYWEYEVPDTVFIHDTVYVNEPTLVSERLLGYEETVLERADKRADAKLKSEPKGGLKNFATDNNVGSKIELEEKKSPKMPADTAENASTDSCSMLLPIHEKVYQDSLYRAVVRGYNPELASLDIYQKSIYYPVVVEKEYDPPNFALTIGPYMGVGNKGFSYGLAISWGWKIDFRRKNRKPL